MTPARLRFRVGEAIARHRLWSPGDRVVVAVSGGRDSVALLDLLCATQAWHQGVLVVATVDHGTRETASADADFVASLAEHRGLPFHRLTASLAGEGEAALRRARLSLLRSVGGVVATGHHRDDQLETILLRLLRGTGGRGLGGIRPHGPGVVHPLLGVSGAALAAWCAHRGLVWRDDPTNATDVFERNRLRQRIVPVLEGVRPGAARGVLQTAQAVAEDAEALDVVAAALDPGLCWPRAALDQPDAILRRWLAVRAPTAGLASLRSTLQTLRAGHSVQLGAWRATWTDGSVVWHEGG